MNLTSQAIWMIAGRSKLGVAKVQSKPKKTPPARSSFLIAFYPNLRLFYQLIIVSDDEVGSG